MIKLRTTAIVAALLLGLAAFRPAGAQESTSLMPPMRWAMVIGANNYPHIGNLSFAANDAKAFEAYLESDLAFDPKNVSFVTDAPDSPRKPTAETISHELDRLLGDPRLNKSDLFIFYFAGHGIGTSKGDYLLPADADPANIDKVGLPVRTVIDKLVAANLRNVLIVADACRTGADNSFGKELTELTTGTNICLILGAQPNSRSYEYPQLSHGVFTYHLLKALRDPASRDPDSGALWASKVAKETSDLVQEFTKRDNPTKPQNPSSWIATRKDVLLKLVATGLEPKVLKDDLAKLGTDERERYALYLLSLSELLANEGKLNQSLETLQALDAVSPDDERIGYFMTNCALRLGRFGLADRIRTRILQKKEWGRYADSLATNSGTYRVPEAQFARAFDNTWKYSEWELRYDMLAYRIAQRNRYKLDYARYCDDLLAGAGKDDRKSNAVLGLKGELAADPKQTSDHLTAALKAPGTVPNSGILVSHAFFALLLQTDVSGAQALISQEANADRDLLLQSAQLYMADKKFDQAKEILKRYFKLGLRADDLQRLMAVCGPNDDLRTMLLNEVMPLQDADWRIKMAKIFMSATSANVQQWAFDLRDLLVEFKEERTVRVGAFLRMCMMLVNSYPRFGAEKYGVYSGAFLFGTYGMPESDGFEPFWTDYRYICEFDGYHYFFSNWTRLFLIDSPTLNYYDPQNLLDIYRTLLQCGFDEQAAKIAKIASAVGVPSKVLLAEAMELFGRGQDDLVQKKIVEIKAAKDTISYTDFGELGLLEEFYAAKREGRKMRLTAFQQPRGIPQIFAKICEMEQPGRTWTDQDSIDAGSIPAVFSACPLMARLFRTVTLDKMSVSERVKMIDQMLDLAQVNGGLVALKQYKVKPGSRLADYAMKIDSTANARISADVAPIHLTLNVDTVGKATGTFEVNAQTKVSITGTVDENGNLEGSMVLGPRTLKMFAKLWPIQDPDCKATVSGKEIKVFFYSVEGDYGWGSWPVDPTTKS